MLQRHGLTGVRWIETGTLPRTTTRLLAGWADTVSTIEPIAELAALAGRRLARLRNVTVIDELSEDVLPACQAR